MTAFQYIVRSLRFHAWGNLALAAGIVVGTAVITGALLVGDSQRGSLKARGEQQLAGLKHLLVSPRFFSEAAAAKVGGPSHPAIVLRGSVTASTERGERRSSGVSVYGVADGSPILPTVSLESGEATLSAALADRLGVALGDSIRVDLEKQSDIPRSSAFGRRGATETTRTVSLKVGAILDADRPGSRFTPTPSTADPLNLWMRLADLHKELRSRGEAADTVNAIFAFGGSRDDLQAEFDAGLTIEDWGLKTAIRGRGTNRYLSVESSRLLLEFPLEDAVVRTAKDLTVAAAPTTVYLVNRMHPGRVSQAPSVHTAMAIGWAARVSEVPYFIVAALDANLPAPLGPFFPENLGPDEILLVDLPGKVFDTEPGKSVELHFYRPETEVLFQQETVRLKVRGRIPLAGVADDAGLTPAFPGITDRLSISDWDPPFPYEPSWITKVDDAFWAAKKATPKAYVSRETGEKLFGSRFGKTTSVRIAAPDGTDLKAFEATFRTALRSRLVPEKSGFAFEPIAERLRASRAGSVDFGLLFNGFSSFLILSALMLVGLLQTLRLAQRSREIGLLLATGWSVSRVRRMLLVEGLTIAVPAGLVGGAVALLYADAMLTLLKRLWPDPAASSFLTLHVSPVSMAVGLVGSIAICFAAILFAVRGLRKRSAIALLGGGREDAKPLGRKKPTWSAWAFAGGAVVAVGSIAAGPFLPPGESRAGAFFTGGIALLSLAMLALWLFLRRDRRDAIRPGPWALSRLALRNASRNPGRSLLTAGLLASAAFLLIAVESFRRSPDDEFRAKTGGSGGFRLVATTDLPIHLNLSSAEGKREVLDGWQRSLQKRGLSPSEAERDALDRRLGENQYYPLRLRAGDDASCLNLYKATRPRVLGVPLSMCYRGGFHFSDSLATTPEQKANPWLLLLESRKADDPVPVFVEENTAMWQLGVSLGGTLPIADESGVERTGRVVGTFKDSIFQSELVIAEGDFRILFPHSEGAGMVLIETSDTDPTATRDVLTAGLSAYGAEVRSTADVVAGFLAVQNAYLSLFQVLGALGLLLGVVGLAVVMLRNVWERRAELALLRATGWSKPRLAALVFRENAALLILGLLAGVLSALISVSPHLAMGGGLPVFEIAATVGILLLAGLLTGLPAMRRTLRTPILTALRHE